VASTTQHPEVVYLLSFGIGVAIISTSFLVIPILITKSPIHFKPLLLPGFVTFSSPSNWATLQVSPHADMLCGQRSLGNFLLSGVDSGFTDFSVVRLGNSDHRWRCHVRNMGLL